MKWLYYMAGFFFGLGGIYLATKKRTLKTQGSADDIVDFFTKNGFPKHQAIGIAGNIKAESNFNSLAQGDNGTAFGIAQWRFDRLDNLKAFADNSNLDYRDFDTQVQFILYEMRVYEKRALQKLIESPDIATATLNFAKYYERPRADLIPKRVDYSNAIASQLA